MNKNKKITTRTIRSKKGKEKITMLTAYDFPIASIMESTDLDMILVGDSLGNVILGYPNTIPVTLEEMIHHTKAVTRAVKNTMVAFDMPFMSYQVNPEQALVSAGRAMKETNVDCVKLEGGKDKAETIFKLTQNGIPVIGHIGLQPQKINQIGGSYVQYKQDDGLNELIEDAIAIQEAGAFCLILELVPKDKASILTQKLDIPTIGIGAGNGCDGQVLVINDMIGIEETVYFKHCRRFANVGEIIRDAINKYIQDVKSGDFPDDNESFQ